MVLQCHGPGGVPSRGSGRHLGIVQVSESVGGFVGFKISSTILVSTLSKQWSCCRAIVHTTLVATFAVQALIYHMRYNNVSMA